MRSASIAILATLSVALRIQPAAGLDLESGDLLVQYADDDHWGVVVRIDPITGDRDPVNQSTSLGGSWGIAFDPVERFVYKAHEFGAVIRLDPATGVETSISEFGYPPTGSGPALASAIDTVVEPDGTIVVADSSIDALVAVDPVSGDRSIVSSAGVGAGPSFGNPRALAREADGSLLVLDTGLGAVVRVDRATGNRTIVSSNSVGSGPGFAAPSAIAVEPGGTLFVADTSSDHILTIDPISGNRTVLSSATVGAGPALQLVDDLALASDGDVLALDLAPSNPKLLRVDRATGDRTVISSSSPVHGPPLLAGAGSSSLVVEGSASALAGVFFGLMRIDLGTGDRTSLVFNDEPSTGRGLALEAGGASVVGGSLFAVVRTQLASGERTLVSASPPSASWLPIGSGPDLYRPLHVISEPAGTLLVSDAGTDEFVEVPGKIVRVSPDTGDRTVVSSATQGSGPAWRHPMDLEITPEGRVFVADPGLLAVLELDPTDGDRWIASGPGVGSGPDFGEPIGLAAAGGALLVADTLAAAVIRIDVASGDRTIVSGPGVGSGPPLSLPTELAVEAGGMIVVTDLGDAMDPQQGAVFRISPTTGNRTIVSSNAGHGSGFGMFEPRGIVVVDPSPPIGPVPALPPWSLAAAALALAALASRRLRAARS